MRFDLDLFELNCTYSFYLNKNCAFLTYKPLGFVCLVDESKTSDYEYFSFYCESILLKIVSYIDKYLNVLYSQFPDYVSEFPITYEILDDVEIIANDYAHDLIVDHYTCGF